MSGEPVYEVPASTPEERNSAAAAHMAPFVGGLLPFFGSFVVTLAVWWLKRESVFVDRHVRAAINFQLSMTLYYGLALGYVYVYVGFGLALLLASGVFETVSMVLAARRAKAGKYYQYRMCLQFLKHGRDGAP